MTLLFVMAMEEYCHTDLSCCAQFRDQARIREEQRAAAAQHDATRQEMESVTETLKTQLNNLREKYEEEQREAQAHAAAAEAEAAQLHAALAAERQHAERAQQVPIYSGILSSNMPGSTLPMSYLQL